MNKKRKKRYKPPPGWFKYRQYPYWGYSSVLSEEVKILEEGMGMHLSVAESFSPILIYQEISPLAKSKKNKFSKEYTRIRRIEKLNFTGDKEIYVSSYKGLGSCCGTHRLIQKEEIVDIIKKFMSGEFDDTKFIIKYNTAWVKKQGISTKDIWNKLVPKKVLFDEKGKVKPRYPRRIYTRRKELRQMVINRIVYTSKSALGKGYIYDDADTFFEFVTLEPPRRWRSKKSYIIQGRYLVEKVPKDGKILYPHFIIRNVKKRTDTVRILAGNFAENLECNIFVGRHFIDLDKDGYLDISHSWNTLQFLFKWLPEQFVLTINNCGGRIKEDGQIIIRR